MPQRFELGAAIRNVRQMVAKHLGDHIRKVSRFRSRACIGVARGAGWADLLFADTGPRSH